ncbi:gephyrin-like molybdotransferase Glp [Microbacterium sp. LWH3-1.2]|uniref:molybdopterin molybdotransferase MoeA n=1 Tax=Microbacterium sp. LWH3-1.2 TaxID=3135256 RepID=UPI00343F9FA0
MTFTNRPVDVHRAIVAQLVAGIARTPETVELRDVAVGPPRSLASDVPAAAELPAFDNSQMDGFAIRSADVRSSTPQRPAHLRVMGHLAAGEHGGQVGAGEAWAVMTGAPIPGGADAVVPIEESGFTSFPARDADAILTVTTPSPVGRFVRARGSDVRAGDPVGSVGSPVTPALVGALAATGVQRIAVQRPLRVLVIATGSELRRSGDPDRPGTILDANTLMLGALLTPLGVRVVERGPVPDDPRELMRLLESCCGEVDLVITAGGVSRGAHEVVRDCLAPRGVEFGTVAMQPGGPQGVGIVQLAGGELPVVALPGNPVSALVSAEVFLRPALLAATGRWAYRPASTAPLAEAAQSPAGKLQVRRGRQAHDGRIHFEGGTASHLLHAYARSTLLAFIPPETTTISVGDRVEFWRIDE